MEYQPGQYGGPGGPVWSGDVASNLAGTFTQWNEGFGREAAMMAQNQKVEEQEAGADWRFAGSVLEKLTPFIKQRIQKNIDKRVSDGLEAYNNVPDLARIESDKAFAKENPELYAAAHRKADGIKNHKEQVQQLEEDQFAWQVAADEYWEKNKNKYMAVEVRESFKEQQWGNAYGYVKGQAIDLAKLYDPANDPVVKASESGTTFQAALNAKQRREIIEPLKDINQELYGTYIEPIVKKANNQAYKNWNSEHIKEVFSQENEARLKAFRHDIESGTDMAKAYTNMVRGSISYMGGSISKAKAYANTLLVQWAGEQLLSENKIKELENLPTKTWTGKWLEKEDSETTLGKLIGKDTFKQMKKVAREARKQALKDSNETSKTNAGFFENSKVEAVKNGDLSIKQALTEYYNSEHAQHKPDLLLEIQTSREQLKEIPLEKQKAHIMDLVKKNKFTMRELLATKNPELISDESLKKMILTYDKTYEEDQAKTKGLINIVNANSQRSGILRLGPSQKAIDFGTKLGKDYLKTVKLRRSMEQPKVLKSGEKETLEEMHRRIGDEVYKELTDWADKHVSRGVSLSNLMKVYDSDKVGVQKTVLNKYQDLENKRDAVNELLNAGARDVANWPPGGDHGPDSNGVVDRPTLLDIRKEVATVAGNRGLYSEGTNIGGALRVKYHSPHPLLLEIAEKTGDSYYGVLNKMLKAFKEEELRLPDSVIEAEKMSPEARQLLNKALKYENTNMFNRAWVEGQLDMTFDTDSEIRWNKAILPGGLGDQVEEAAKANNQDPAEIASWVELLQTKPDYMNFENLDGISESPFPYTIDERTKEQIQIERQQILAKYRKGQDVDLSPLIFSSLQYNR
tara:strand:+ start:1095 stop:3665 length:2571 start_codon:yes stop_codon:yes gene_type:complete